MVDVTLSTTLFPLFDEIGTALESGALNPAETYSDQLDLLDVAVEANEPTVEVLSSTLIQFGVPVPGQPGDTFHFALAGTGFSPVSTVDALMQAIMDGVATGAFSTFTVRLNTTAIATFTFGATGYTYVSGLDRATVQGTLPTDFPSMIELIGLLSEANPETIDAMTAQERSDYFAALGDFGVTGLQVQTSSSGSLQTVFDLQITEDSITLSNAMVTMTLAGSFPVDFGQVAAIAYDIWATALASGGAVDLTTVEGLAIDSFTIADADGTVLLNGVGPVTGNDAFDVVMTGTTGVEDLEFWDAPFVDIAGTGSLLANLDGGNDQFAFDFHDFYWGAFNEGLTPDMFTDITVNAGDGTDSLLLSSWYYSGRTEVNLRAGTISGFGESHVWGTADTALWSVAISGFETLILEGGPAHVTGADISETLVLTETQNAVYNGSPVATVVFDAGLGTDVLDLSQARWWADGVWHYGMTQAEFFSLYSWTVNDDGFLVLSSISGDLWSVPMIELRGAESLRFLTTTGGTALFSLSTLHITETLEGSESYIGGDNADYVTGSTSDNLIDGGNGNDSLLGDAGNDTILGGDGNDTVVGGLGDDSLSGGDTTADLRDLIYGGGGNDTIDGGYGNDELRGDDGNDAIEGYFGSDTLIGGTGNDTLSGSALSDQIFGGDGNDFLNGGFGHDRMNGGTGADRFYHLGIANHGSDWVQDYNAVDGDRLVFGNAAATRTQFQINYGTTVGAGDAAVQEAFVVYRPTGQVIWALVDGAGQDHIYLQIGAATYDLMA